MISNGTAIQVATGDGGAEVELSATTSSSEMWVTFSDLSYSVPLPKQLEPLTILSRVSGRFAPGQLTALMGPSGCGKTTLLDIVAGRKTSGTITGDVLFGGAKPSAAVLRRLTGYVEQFGEQF